MQIIYIFDILHNNQCTFHIKVTLHVKVNKNNHVDNKNLTGIRQIIEMFEISI